MGEADHRGGQTSSPLFYAGSTAQNLLRSSATTFPAVPPPPAARWRRPRRPPHRNTSILRRKKFILRFGTGDRPLRGGEAVSGAVLLVGVSC